MEKVSYLDLFDVAENLQIALNALACFDEFCEDEGMRQSKTTEEEKAACFAFKNRLPQFISILHLATTKIMVERDKVEACAENLRLSKGGVA